MRRIYVASSWRNETQPGVVNWLRALGHEVYDFRHPRTGGPADPRTLERGFHWSEIDPDWQEWSVERYRQNLLGSQVAADGFAGDWSAMNWADTGVLVLPSGRSSHLEAGYFTGHPSKQLHVLLPPEGRMEPELMYLMADGLHLHIGDLGRAVAEPIGAMVAA